LTGRQSRNFKKAITGAGLALTGAEAHDVGAKRHDAAIAQFAPWHPDVLIQQASIGQDGGNIVRGMQEIRLEVRIVRPYSALQDQHLAEAAGPIFSRTRHPRADVCRVYRLPRRSGRAIAVRQNSWAPEGVRAGQLRKLDYSPARSSTTASLILKAAIEATKSLDGRTLERWIGEQRRKVEWLAAKAEKPMAKTISYSAARP